MSVHYTLADKDGEEWLVVMDRTLHRLFKPGTWGYSPTMGISYYPSSGINLPRSRWLAHLVAKWHVWNWQSAKNYDRKLKRDDAKFARKRGDHRGN